MACSRCLLDHCGILLSDLVKLRDTDVDLTKAGRLFRGAVGNIADEGGDICNGSNDIGQRLSGAAHPLDTGPNMFG